MSQEAIFSNKKKKKTEEPELPPPWKHVQSAIWLLGLATLAWQDWWWPGILVLVAISGLTQAGIQLYLSSKEKEQQATLEEKQLDLQRGEWLPDVCPKCGAPLSVSMVTWTGPATADCPYCKANLKRPA